MSTLNRSITFDNLQVKIEESDNEFPDEIPSPAPNRTIEKKEIKAFEILIDGRLYEATVTNVTERITTVPKAKVKAKDKATTSRNVATWPHRRKGKNMKSVPTGPAPSYANRKCSYREFKLSSYNKDAIIKQLKDFGCGAENLEQVLMNFKVHKEGTLGYFNEHLKDAQTYVHQECNSLSFANISEWLQYFQKRQLQAQCLFEPAVIVNAIAHNEQHPPKELFDGVDLKSVYKFVGNALLGLPQPELSASDAAFLIDEFASLINEANTDAADIETRYLKRKILDPMKVLYYYSTKKEAESLDPLRLDDEINLKLSYPKYAK